MESTLQLKSDDRKKRATLAYNAQRGSGGRYGSQWDFKPWDAPTTAAQAAQLAGLEWTQPWTAATDMSGMRQAGTGTCVRPLRLRCRWLGAKRMRCLPCAPQPVKPQLRGWG